MKFFDSIKIIKTLEVKDAINNCEVLHIIPLEKIEYVENFYIEVAENLGKLFSSEEDFGTKNKTGNLWSEIKYIKEKSESFSHSNTRQPFHTDGAYESNAPDISFFYCIEKANFGGATTFVDSDVLLDCLNFYNKSLLRKIQNTPICHHKGNDQKILPILKDNNWNWNYFRAEKNKIVEEFNYFLEEIIYKSGLYRSIILNPGEALFFWDHKVLHGRNAFLGNRYLRKAGVYV